MAKEVNKEQPSFRNLSATATRVRQCTCPVAASRKDFSAIHTSPQTILDKKYNKIFIIYKEIQQGSGPKSYVTNGLLIYGKIQAVAISFSCRTAIFIHVPNHVNFII
jgi:hypothetical protein